MTSPLKGLSMREKIDDLCGDPLFQLNLAIWLAQSTPASFSVRPVFYESGFKIHSIGPLLPLPPDIRLQARESQLDCQDGAKPELILEAGNRSKLVIVECKRSSFGSSSSTASQARTLLLASGPIMPEVLAIGKRSSAQGMLCYLTRSDQVSLLENTLVELTQEIQRINLSAGYNGCLGIIPDDTGILLVYSDEMKTLLNFQDISPTKILDVEEETDPRPLYFIPYDPNIEQSSKEQALCRRMLYERFLGFILSRIGPANVPCEVTFSREEILMSATFGVYEIWDDSETKKSMKRLVRDFMDSVLKGLKNQQQKYLEYQSDRGWVFKLEDQDIYEEMVNRISKFKPEDMDLSKEIGQLYLFEE